MIFKDVPLRIQKANFLLLYTVYDELVQPSEKFLNGPKLILNSVI